MLNLQILGPVKLENYSQTQIKLTDMTVLTEYFFDKSAFSSSKRSFRRPVIIKSYPCFANSIAVDFPMPEVAPVINAIIILKQ